MVHAAGKYEKMFHVEHWDAIAIDIQYEGHIERQKNRQKKSCGWRKKISLTILITNPSTL